MVFVTIAGRLVQLQVVQAAPLENLGERQRIDEITLPAKRGTIFDRAMAPLAVSLEARAVTANPGLLAAEDPDLEALAAQVAPLLGVSEAHIVGQLSKDSGFVYLARRVRPDIAQRVLDLGIPHIYTLKETRREYPADDLAGQVLGFVNVDNLGLSGVESMFDPLLSGEPGLQVVESDPRGRPIPQGRSQIVAPVPGDDLVLTIDRQIQYTAESALRRGARKVGAKGGTAVVMDPRTGEVLAMANWPPLNPNEFGDATGDARRNRVAMDAYEPGSVNKVITAAASIEEGLVTPATELVVPDDIEIAGYTFRDFAPHPTERLTYGEALARSSNVATIKVAQRLGRERLYRALRRFGLGTPTGVGVPGESPGIVLQADDWWPTSMATIPIGQGIAATPLQMASVYATLANDGVRVQPRIVNGTVDQQGEFHGASLGEQRRVVRPATAALVRGMLLGVVEHGTGTMAQIPGYLVGGKTGTARVPHPDRPGYSTRIVTTFAGMAPIDSPRLVVLVQLDNPWIRFASHTAAPIFRQIMQYSLARLGVAPTVHVRDVDSLEARAPAIPKAERKDRTRPPADAPAAPPSEPALPPEDAPEQRPRP